jgi:hypothetical protein
LENEVENRKTDSEVKTEIEQLMNGELIGKLQGMERVLCLSSANQIKTN